MKFTNHPSTLIIALLTLWTSFGSVATAQTISAPTDIEIKIGIEPNKSDDSIVNIEGTINNRGNRSRYIYYIVAKAIVGETAVKQTIVPVNSKIEPGEVKVFKHVISKDSLPEVSGNQIRVVKYESRSES